MFINSIVFKVQLGTLPTQLTFEDIRQQQRTMCDHTNNELKEAFLDMLATLFGDIYNHMIVGERYFDRPSYLASRDDDERSFFIEVSKSTVLIKRPKGLLPALRVSFLDCLN